VLGRVHRIEDSQRKAARCYSQVQRRIDIGVSVYDISEDGLRQMGTCQWNPDSPYDAWWLGFIHDVSASA
jgi:hypothetical protein